MTLRIRNLLAWLMAAPILFVVAGCEPHVYPFSYLSLAGYADAKVVKRGKLTANLQTHLLTGPVALEYRINRPLYDLRVRLDPDSWDATLFFYVITKSDGLPDPGMTIGFTNEKGRCGYWWNPDLPSWDTWHFTANGCPAGSGTDQHVIHFDVRDADGAVIGREAIPFTVVPAGFIFDIESI